MNLNNDFNLISNKNQQEHQENKKSLSSSALLSRNNTSPPIPFTNKKSSINDLSSMTTTSVTARINRKRSAAFFEENIKEKKILIDENIFLKDFDGENKNNEDEGEKMKDVGFVEKDARPLEKMEFLIKTPEAVNNRDLTPLKTCAASFVLSWQVEWSGTFPLGKITTENIAKRLDSLISFKSSQSSTNIEIPSNQQKLANKRSRMTETSVYLTISFEKEQGGILCVSDSQNAKIVFLTHQISKICCVVARVETKQLAYITREQPSNNLHKINYRKQCHVFRTKTALEVEEIEFALSSLFQQQKNLEKNSIQMFNSPISPPKRQIITSTTSVRDVATSPLSLQKQNYFVCVDPEGSDFVNPSPLKNNKKDKISSIGFLERSRSQMLTISSSSLIQKIFGVTPKKKQKQQRNKNNSPLINEQRKQSLATPTSLQNGETANFRKPRWPLTPLRSFNSTSTCSPTPIKQIPPHTPTNNYFHSSKPQIFELPCKKEKSCYNLNFPSVSIGNHFETNLPQKQQNWFYNNGYNSNNIYPTNYYPQIPIYNKRYSRDGQPELVYDERLKEWIYPLGECLRDELERLAYFCRPNEKDYVINQLCLMPPGHFMLRLSGSRQRCLALTMRVPENIDGTINRKRGIANYLIIRNVHGFRIRGSKRYFQSLPMLITHHSVLPEQLPCRLQLSDWRWTREPKTNTLLRRQSSGGSTAIAMRSRDEEGRHSPSDSSNMMVRWRRPLPQNDGNVHLNQNGKDYKQQKLSVNASTRTNSINTMFSSKSSTLLSA